MGRTLTIADACAITGARYCVRDVFTLYLSRITPSALIPFVVGMKLGEDRDLHESKCFWARLHRVPLNFLAWAHSVEDR